MLKEVVMDEMGPKVPSEVLTYESKASVRFLRPSLIIGEVEIDGGIGNLGPRRGQGENGTSAPNVSETSKRAEKASSLAENMRQEYK